MPDQPYNAVVLTEQHTHLVAPVSRKSQYGARPQASMELSAEYVVGLVELIIYLLGAGLLSGVGLYIESIAYGLYLAGDVTVALWVAALGVLTLYMGIYAVGITEALPRVQAVRSEQ